MLIDCHMMRLLKLLDTHGSDCTITGGNRIEESIFGCHMATRVDSCFRLCSSSPLVHEKEKKEKDDTSRVH